MWVSIVNPICCLVSPMVMLYVLDPLNLIIASPVKHSFCHSPASWNTEFLSCVRSHTYTLP